MAVPAGGTATLCPRIGGAFACLSAVLLPLAICAALPGNHTHAGGTTTDVAAKSPLRSRPRCGAQPRLRSRAAEGWTVRALTSYSQRKAH